MGRGGEGRGVAWKGGSGQSISSVAKLTFYRVLGESLMKEDFPREQSWPAEMSDCGLLNVRVFGKLVMHRPNLAGCGGRNPH